MEDPDWAKALSYFYKEQETVFYLHELGESHKLVEFTDIPAHELEMLLNDMHENKLLEMNFPPTTVDTQEGKWKTEGIEFSLSEKGFDVAHEREMKKGSQDINFSLMALTAILALTALVQAISSVLILDGFERNAMLVGTIIILICIVVIAHKTSKKVNSSTL